MNTSARKRKADGSRAEEAGLLFNSKHQSPIVITTPARKVRAKASSTAKFDLAQAFFKYDETFKLRTNLASDKQTLHSRRASAPSKSFVLQRLSQSSAILNPCLPLLPTPMKTCEGLENLLPMYTPSNVEDKSVKRSLFSGYGGVRQFETPTSTSSQGTRQLVSARKLRLKAAMQLKAFENRELRALRCENAKREIWMRRQERGYTIWLNFLLKQPMNGHLATAGNKLVANVCQKKCGEAFLSCVIKSNRDHSEGSNSEEQVTPLVSPNRYSSLEADIFAQTPTSDLRSKSKAPRSILVARKTPNPKERKENYETCSSNGVDAYLQAICSLTDLRQRLIPYFDDHFQEDFISIIMHLAKHIDEGRLRMKDGCAILSDIALKQKALKVLTSYNPSWLKIGLQIVLGSNVFKALEMADATYSTRACEDGDEHSDDSYLELFLEKNFFAHAGLAKLYAKNKSIEGLYRDGYDAALGRVILKRFFMLVLVLDKLKTQHMLQPGDGIDGLDGGVSLLFRRSAVVKSSRKALQDFLSNAMHGEGDLLVHLGALGYHVSHVQAPLADYNFEIVSLVKDLQDGVRLCRLAQLMRKDTSVLLKVKLPIRARKRQKQNCEIALQSLAQAGVPLVDEQGYFITADDIVEGAREKAFCLLWNVMLHLQIPLLISKERLLREIIQIEGVKSVNEVSLTTPTIDLLLKWTKVVCAKYDVHVDDFKASFSSGQALCCLLSFYLPSYLPPTAILHKRWNTSTQEFGPSESSISEPGNNPINKETTAHNFDLVQEVVHKLGEVPEVLRMADLIDDPSPCEQIVIMYLAFLCGYLLSTKQLAVETINCGAVQCSDKEARIRYQMIHVKAAIKIQSWYRSVQQRLHFRKLKSCCLVLQRRVRASQERNKFHNGGGCCENQKVSANECIEEKLCTNISEDLKSGTPVLETKQRRYGVFLVHEVAAALQIQSHWRGHCQRHVFAKQRAAIVLIQAYYRAYKQSRTYKKLRSGIMKVQVLYRHKLAKAKLEAQAQIDDKCQIEIMHHQKLVSEGQKVQALWRSYKARKSYLKQKSAAKKIQQQWRSYLVHRYKIFAAVKIQAHVRRYFAQNVFLKQMTAVICIQKYYRAYIQRITYRKYREKITKIQGFLRSRSIRRKYQERRQASMKIQSAFRLWRESQHVSKAAEVNQLIHTSAQRIQAAWRRFLHNRMEKKSNAAVVVQAAYKAWKTRKEFRFQIKKIIYLQAYYRGSRIRRKIIKKRTQHTLPNPMPNAVTLEKEEQLQPRSFTSNDGDPAPDQSIAASCRYGLENCSSVTELDTEEKLSPSDGEASSILINGVGIHAMAAVRIQACWRDYRSRREISSSERVCDKLGNIHSSHGWDSSGKVFNSYEQQAWWILSKWSGTFRQRLWFLRAKRSAVKIQKWWISVAERRSRAAHIIQRHFQSWKLRKYFKQAKLSTIIIQAHWRGHLTRKHMDHASRQLMDLRRRMQYTAATMDSNMSLGNRLKVALAALLDHKTVSGILKTCATIDMATQHSIYCCEKLAEGGAITKLLQLIQTTNRSPPHEQVLKHALSILGNLARCPDLAARILKTPGFLEIVAEQLQMCRNKEEIFFKAMRVLQLVCANSECPDFVQKRPLILRRLQHLADLLDQKVAAERRNFEKLSETVGFQTRKLAEKKVEEAITQSQSVIMLLKTLTKHNVNEYNKHTENRRGGGGPFPVHASKRSSIGVLSLPKRPPLQNCSNKKVF